MNDQTGEPIGHRENVDVSIDPGAAHSRAVAELYAEHGERVQRFLWGLLGDADAAAEAMQSVFRIALESMGEVPPDSQKAWLYKVAYNEAMGLRRRQRMVQRRQGWVARPQADAAANPAEQTIQEEDVHRVRAAIAQLPAEQQNVVRLRIYEGLTFQQISDQSGMPLGTVLTRMRLALKRLQALLEKDSGECE